jgi:hypothetical protein
MTRPDTHALLHHQFGALISAVVIALKHHVANEVM